jgi:hypothetical protein
VLFWICVLVCFCCCNRTREWIHCKGKKLICLMVLEAGKPRAWTVSALCSGLVENWTRHWLVSWLPDLLGRSLTHIWSWASCPAPPLRWTTTVHLRQPRADWLISCPDGPGFTLFTILGLNWSSSLSFCFLAFVSFSLFCRQHVLFYFVVFCYLVSPHWSREFVSTSNSLSWNFFLSITVQQRW